MRAGGSNLSVERSITRPCRSSTLHVEAPLLVLVKVTPVEASRLELIAVSEGDEATEGGSPLGRRSRPGRRRDGICKGLVLVNHQSGRGKTQGNQLFG